jgi:hypothetical protein
VLLLFSLPCTVGIIFIRSCCLNDCHDVNNGNVTPNYNIVSMGKSDRHYKISLSELSPGM